MTRQQRVSRRSFLGVSAGVSAGWFVAGFPSLGRSDSPNEKLNLGVVGPAGRGGDNLNGVAHQNIVAICDIDKDRAAEPLKRFPGAKFYQDYRKLIDAEKIDGIVVSTADHTHAHASITAMRRGIHCYCEKPLTHSVWEARLAARTAKEYHVVTQMGTQIHAENNYRRVVEVIQSGAIGPVRKVHVWVGKGWGGGDRPTEKPAVPANLDWDLWLGPAPERPYNATYLPANWRRWWDFGNGTLGDMGCHYMDLVFWALGLRHPKTIQAEGPPVHAETAPLGMKVTYEFPAGGTNPDQPPVTLIWTDGDKIETKYDGQEFPGAGIYFVGDKGRMFADYGSFKLFPAEMYNDFKSPEQTIPNSIGHHEEWIQAIKNNGPTTCNFDYSGALTETVLLGMVAYRVGQKIEWDAENLKVTNCPAAAPLIRREYRAGWEL